MWKIISVGLLLTIQSSATEINYPKVGQVPEPSSYPVTVQCDLDVLFIGPTKHIAPDGSVVPNKCWHLNTEELDSQPQKFTPWINDVDLSPIQVNSSSELDSAVKACRYKIKPFLQNMCTPQDYVTGILKVKFVGNNLQRAGYQEGHAGYHVTLRVKSASGEISSYIIYDSGSDCHARPFPNELLVIDDSAHRKIRDAGTSEMPFDKYVRQCSVVK